MKKSIRRDLEQEYGNKNVRDFWDIQRQRCEYEARTSMNKNKRSEIT